MWSSSNVDLKSIDLVMNQERKPEFEPTPYTFTTIENGKKIVVDPSSLSPPSWLLLDHTVAVIWWIFTSNSTAQLLSIDDLKWAHEFLKEVRNKKGENPPDVKVCLQEIQNRLIHLYANLTSLKDEDFDEIAAAFGEKIMEESSSFLSACEDPKQDSLSIFNYQDPSKTSIKHPLSGFFNRPIKDLVLSKKEGNGKQKSIAMNYSRKTFPMIENDSNVFDEQDSADDENVEKYFLSLFDEDKKEDLQKRMSSKSFIPTKRKPPSALAFSEMIATKESPGEVSKGSKDKTSKKVHCVAEMRSLKFQKSLKVQDTNVSDVAEETFRCFTSYASKRDMSYTRRQPVNG